MSAPNVMPAASAETEHLPLSGFGDSHRPSATLHDVASAPYVMPAASAETAQ